MLSEISFEQDLDDNGYRIYRITGMENVLKMSELPGEYFSKIPYYYLHRTDGKLVLVIDGGERDIEAKLGTTFRQHDYVEFIHGIKESGRRLTKIIGRIERDKENWVGKKFTVVV